MTAIKTGTTVVVVPRAAPSAAHALSTSSSSSSSSAARANDDTLEVSSRRAAQTGPTGSARYAVAVDARASGAYFNKVVVPARRDAHGIRVEARLPDVILDPTRFFVAGGPPGHGVGTSPIATTRRVLEQAESLDAAMASLTHWKTGPTDTPSVYLGGRAAGQEADVGLSYNRVLDTHGRAVFSDLPEGSDARRLRDPTHQFSFDAQQRALVDGTGAVVASGDAAVRSFMIARQMQPLFAFRPYWRVSPSEPGTTNWTNPPASSEKAAAWAAQSNHVGAVPPNVYFYPGEHIAMNVSESAPGQLRLSIRGNGADGDLPALGVTFRARAFGQSDPVEFKRVSSIDQRGNEGKSVTPTSSMAIGLVWEKTELLLGADAASSKPTPLSSLAPVLVRGHDLKDPARYHRIFNLDVVDGKEIVTIRPS
jgi:hypothetical protein